MLNSLTLTSTFPCKRQVVHSKCRSYSFAEPCSGADAVRERRSSLYDVLRVKTTASTVEIKAAYRTLAKIYHPDTFTITSSSSSSSSDIDSNGMLFIEIHNAYQTLSDPTSRALYDMSLCLAIPTHPSSSFGYCSMLPNSPTRRWETDQCW